MRRIRRVTAKSASASTADGYGIASESAVSTPRSSGNLSTTCSRRGSRRFSSGPATFSWSAAARPSTVIARRACRSSSPVKQDAASSGSLPSSATTSRSASRSGARDPSHPPSPAVGGYRARSHSAPFADPVIPGTRPSRAHRLVLGGGAKQGASRYDPPQVPAHQPGGPRVRPTRAALPCQNRAS